MRETRYLTYAETLEWVRSRISDDWSQMNDSKRGNYVTFLALLESGSLDNHGDSFICLTNGELFGLTCKYPGDLLRLIPGTNPDSTIYTGVGAFSYI